MSVRQLFVVCVLGVVLSVAVAGLAARDLLMLASVDALPDVQGLAKDDFLASNTQIAQLALQSRTEMIAALKNFRAATVSALALARSGAQHRVVLGLGFAVMFGVISSQVFRLSRQV